MIATRDQLRPSNQQLPIQLRGAMTWDRGRDMRGWEGLLRQYFPKGTSLDGFIEGQPYAVAHELNDRPRKRLEFQTTNEIIRPVLL